MAGRSKGGPETAMRQQEASANGRMVGGRGSARPPMTRRPGSRKLRISSVRPKEKLKRAIADSQRLAKSRRGTHTVKSWVRMWHEVYAEPRLRENTKDYYLNYINNHIIPELGGIKLDKLPSIRIQKFYNWTDLDWRTEPSPSRSR